MPASIEAAKAGVTTGEWGDVIRAVFGQYRAPTGVSDNPSNQTDHLDDIRTKVSELANRLGRKPRVLVGKPGLDGHSNGAEQIASRLRDVGMEMRYDGIRLTPEEIVAAAQDQNADVIGLSILSGSHLPLVEELISRLAALDMGQIPVVVGGIIPEVDAERLREMGVAKVYTPKDFELNLIMSDIVELVRVTAHLEAAE